MTDALTDRRSQPDEPTSSRGELCTSKFDNLTARAPHQYASQPPKYDPVNHPKHYKSHPSGIEVIQITEHMNFCLGNAVKYILRADHKGNAIEDLEKAAWYINREIERRKKK